MSASNGIKQVRDLLDLSIEEKRKFLDSFDIMMTDCDGVIWNLFAPIPGTGKALTDVENAGKRVIYVSNNSMREDSAYEKRIGDIGARFKQENLVHPVLSIIHYLKKINFQGLIYLIGSSNVKNLLCKAGFNVIDGPKCLEKEDLQAMVKIATDGLPVKAVIVDFDFNYSYIQILRAEVYLRDPECQLIVGVTEKRLPLMPDLEYIGPSYVGELLAATLTHERKPIVLGKPGDALGDVLKDRYKIKDPQRVLFVGDLPYSDIKFARKHGFQSLLVLTGGTKKEDMLSIEDSNEIPDFYADSITALSTLIRSLPSETKF